MKRVGTLRRRLMLAFAVFGLLVAILFSAFALVFTYAVEDQFFTDRLEEEAAAQRDHHAKTGRWMQPRGRAMQVHETTASFPADLAASYSADTTRNEYAGDAGRHYHLRRLHAEATSPESAFLVAEVSEQLVVRGLRNEILRWLAGVAAVVLLGALLVGFWLARRTAQPLVLLAAQVQAMQPQQPPESFSARPSILEIDVLARGLEALASRIHAFTRREREFTCDASHELRTPLAVIHSACDRLANDAQMSAQSRQQVDFMRQSVRQLEQTVSALLALAREENAVLAAEPVALLPVLERVIVEQADHLDGKAVEVQLQVQADACMEVPPSVLHMLLANLVGNAFAHTATGFVRIDFAGGRLHIVNSSPLDPALDGNLRRPFAKGGASSGHGLGLAIAARLCERHAIDLCIDSDEHGTHASFACVV